MLYEVITHTIAIWGIRVSFLVHIAEEHLGRTVRSAARHRHDEQEAHVDRTDDEKGQRRADIRPDQRNGDRNNFV